MKFEKFSLTAILAVAAVTATAPAAAAFPTGSAGLGDGREVVIVDNNLELSDLDSCWASGFQREIRFDNRSTRDFHVYNSPDCSGAPVATVPAGHTATHYGWSASAR
ncbi:hypothetical protein [Nocardia grenadensis]|uniref:hypothetical protein n=1 Tax=Nocardia grenadensis TaxID=931537 RepID=UPI0007A3F665|nr:hypothetical protein [Nocardia grenadensis]